MFISLDPTCLELPDGKAKGLTARCVHFILVLVILEGVASSGCYAVLDKQGQAGGGNSVREIRSQCETG